MDEFKKITAGTSSVELSKIIVDLMEPFKEMKIISVQLMEQKMQENNNTTIFIILPVFLDLLTYTKAYRKRINNDNDDENIAYFILDDTKLSKTRDDLCFEIEQRYYDSVTYSDSEDDIESNFEETVNNNNIKQLLEKFQLELEKEERNSLKECANKFWENLEKLSFGKIEQLEGPNNNINNKLTVRDENNTYFLYSEIKKVKVVRINLIL
uniref:Uncharacterized protein n=1 Tax=Strongyloides venezuelensis TaxID=75913 RepID=A0A0K0F148_STRVS